MHGYTYVIHMLEKIKNNVNVGFLTEKKIKRSYKKEDSRINTWKNCTLQTLRVEK